MNNETFTQAYFTGAQYKQEYSGLPFYSEIFPLPSMTSGISAKIENMVFDIAPDGFADIEGVEPGEGGN